MSDSTVVGLHVSGSTLRCAKVHRAAGRIEVVSLQRTDWPVREPAGGANATLCGITSEAAPGPTASDPTTIIASMPGPDVMTRCWTLPHTDATRFRQMVAHRLEADLPVPMEELVWGYRIGEAQVSELHGNFFMNTGSATATDVLALIKHVRAEVQRQFGVTLELEIELVGW